MLNVARGKYFAAMEELAKFGTKHRDNQEILLYFNSKLSLLKTKWNETREVFNGILRDGDKAIFKGEDFVAIKTLIELFEYNRKAIEKRIETWKAEYEAATEEPKKKKQKLTECKHCGAKFIGKKNLQFCKDCE